jgi:hypothetical protein
MMILALTLLVVGGISGCLSGAQSGGSRESSMVTIKPILGAEPPARDWRNSTPQHFAQTFDVRVSALEDKQFPNRESTNCIVLSANGPYAFKTAEARQEVGAWHNVNGSARGVWVPQNPQDDTLYVSIQKWNGHLGLGGGTSPMLIPFDYYLRNATAPGPGPDGTPRGHKFAIKHYSHGVLLDQRVSVSLDFWYVSEAKIWADLRPDSSCELR